jgi:hypothetical protein
MTGTTLVPMLSGARIDLLAPDWRSVELSDVAYGLAAQRRWVGQARRQVSIADHSNRVAELVKPRRLRLAARLHDGHEYAWGDWPLPALNALAAQLGPEIFADVDSIKRGLDVAIARRVLSAYGPASWPEGESEDTEAHLLAAEMRAEAVHRADAEAARIEACGSGRGGVTTFELGPTPAESTAALAWLAGVKADCFERYEAPQ